MAALKIGFRSISIYKLLAWLLGELDGKILLVINDQKWKERHDYLQDDVRSHVPQHLVLREDLGISLLL